MSKIWYLVVSTMLVILLVVNSVSYISVRNALIDKQETEVEIIAKNIKNSIETTKKSEDYFNLMLSERLRLSSIAIQNQLPPDIKDVKEEELVQLSKMLGLKGIALWMETSDNITVIKSSNPEEVGLESKGWSEGKWYKMFQGLLHNYDVELIEGFGEELENFWAGPVDTSTVDSKSISKWGYYHDGTTNYMINPYVEETLITSFHKEVGIQKTIDELLEEHPYLLEISILNSEILKTGEKTIRDTGVVWQSDKLVVYGSYDYANKTDHKNVQAVLDRQKDKNDFITIDGQKVLKKYIPTGYTNGDNLNQELILVITSDYQQIEAALKIEMQHLLLISFLVSIIGISAIYFVVQFIKKQENTIIGVQSIYLKNIESLYQTVKEYRHDFNNHVFTILGMAKMKMFEDLEKYVTHLSTVQKDFNDIFNVNIPALSGLLQAKIAKASETGVSFEHQFEQFAHVKLDMDKTTNLVKVVGNILDNAFHAVGESDRSEKKVAILGHVEQNTMIIHIQNNGAMISKEDLDRIFENGFTTKKDRGGSGIGLASSRKIMERMKGSLHCESDERWTTFTIQMPLVSKELQPATRKDIKETMTI